MSTKVVLGDSRLLTALACAALSLGLRRVLLFDASPGTLNEVATKWMMMLEQVHGQPVQLVTLGPTVQEDDLWGQPGIEIDEQNQKLIWQAGLLTPRKEGLLLVKIPDLTKLSLAAARAFVTLGGAEVVHVERHGYQLQDIPRICWLAGCASEEIGQLSAHLLDRFTLRLHAPLPEKRGRVHELLALLAKEDFLPKQHIDVPIELLANLSKASGFWPAIASDAVDEIREYFAVSEPTSIRRPVSLLRLAVAYARLSGDKVVIAEHVEEAAKLIGLISLKERLLSEPLEERPGDAQSSYGNTLPPTGRGDDAQEVAASLQLVEEGKGQDVYASDASETMPQAAFTFAGVMPYPEDSAHIDHGAVTLQLPFRQSAIHPRGRGEIVGVERTSTLQDLSLVYTLLEAAKYKVLRHAHDDGRDVRSLSPIDLRRYQRKALLLSPVDLRRFRRKAVAEQMLVLILDYTSMRDCEWQASVLPYLRWCYTERASICLVAVGAADAQNELRAMQVLAKNILEPQIVERLAYVLAALRRWRMA